MTVDPVNNCTFWYVQMVATGATQIASFRFDTCGTDLAISKSASPSPAAADGILTYTITVLNNGSLNATNVIVVDTLPAGTTYQANTDSCVQSPPGTLTCSLGPIAAGAALSFDIQVKVGASVIGTITNTATVSADQVDLDPSNNHVSVTTGVTSTWGRICAGRGITRSTSLGERVRPATRGSPSTARRRNRRR